jgi:hypothetical protein
VGNVEQLIPGRLIGLQGRLARPFWGVMGIWAVLCGSLASSGLRWDGESLLTLVLVLLLADLAWGSLWDLVAGTDWFGLLAAGWPPKHSATLALPYVLPDAPGGRLMRGLNRVVGWWRETFWPAAGPALLGVLVAVVLAVVLSLLLPGRLRLLSAILVALLGLGLIQRCRGREALAGTALVGGGLCWLAGHMAFFEIDWASLVLALGFSAAVWGGLRTARGLRGGLWLLNGGQAACVALLVTLKQPLAAGAIGLLLFGQIALQLSLHWQLSLHRQPSLHWQLSLHWQPSLHRQPLLHQQSSSRQGAEAMLVFRRTWPWLMAAMLVAALALP